MTESLRQMPWGNDGGWPWLCGRERPCPDHDQPATVGEALRLAARSMNCMDDAEALTAMAAELDTAPAPVYQLPAEPPDTVTELWEVSTGRRWDRYDVRGGWSADDGKSIWPWPEPVIEAGEDGPLSTTPPTAEPELTADHCLGCNAPMVRRNGRLEHRDGDPRRCSPPAGTEAER